MADPYRLVVVYGAVLGDPGHVRPALRPRGWGVEVRVWRVVVRVRGEAAPAPRGLRGHVKRGARRSPQLDNLGVPVSGSNGSAITGGSVQPPVLLRVSER